MRSHARTLNPLPRRCLIWPAANFLLRQCCAPLRSSRNRSVSWPLTAPDRSQSNTSCNNSQQRVPSHELAAPTATPQDALPPFPPGASFLPRTLLSEAQFGIYPPSAFHQTTGATQPITVTAPPKVPQLLVRLIGLAIACVLHASFEHIRERHDQEKRAIPTGSNVVDIHSQWSDTLRLYSILWLHKRRLTSYASSSKLSFCHFAEHRKQRRCRIWQPL